MAVNGRMHVLQVEQCGKKSGGRAVLWVGWPREWGEVWVCQLCQMQTRVTESDGPNLGHCGVLGLAPAKLRHIGVADAYPRLRTQCLLAQW